MHNQNPAEMTFFRAENALLMITKLIFDLFLLLFFAEKIPYTPKESRSRRGTAKRRAVKQQWTEEQPRESSRRSGAARGGAVGQQWTEE